MKRSLSLSWKSACALAVLLLAAAPGAAQRGGIALPQSLDELTQEAHVIVRGHVMAAHAERHPQLTNLNTLVITVRVQETLKGEAGRTLTFRQFVWDIRDTYDHAGYKKGQEVLLLLTKPTEAGLSSTVGLSQGRFHIERAAGRAQAVNGAANTRLFEGLRRPEKLAALPSRLQRVVREHRGGALELQDLQDLILHLERSRR
jgi:hypothetical protein